MQTNLLQPSASTEANDSRIAYAKAVVCKELFGSVYDLLVSIGGAHRLDKGIFVYNHSERQCDEWRFQGHLGFGGKYRRKSNTVDCYPEDTTPERRAIIERLNAELAKLPNGPDQGRRASDSKKP